MQILQVKCFSVSLCPEFSVSFFILHSIYKSSLGEYTLNEYVMFLLIVITMTNLTRESSLNFLSLVLPLSISLVSTRASLLFLSLL